MARIAGVNIPKEKRVLISLTYIYGIGLASSKKIMAEAQIAENVRTKDLTEEQIKTLRNIIDEKYTVEGDLRRDVMKNIKDLKDIACYRGIRHRKGLPVRGQNTKSNAVTRKGKRTAIAGKKK